MTQEKNTHIQIMWREVDSLTDMRGHGVDVYYATEETNDNNTSSKKMIPVAYIDTYYWFDKPAKRVKVDVIEPGSAIFINSQPGGSVIISKLKKELSQLIQSRTMPPNKFGEYFMSCINA